MDTTNSNQKSSPSGFLGLAPSTTSSKSTRSLSIRTADGSNVSILNDENRNYSSIRSTMSDTDHRTYRHPSVPDMTPDLSPLGTSLTRSPVIKEGISSSPQLTPTRLPSISSLIQAVNMTTRYPEYNQIPVCAPQPLPLPIQLPTLSNATAQRSPLPSKRKYHCHYPGCGKSFTTSGHLSRHNRIHTGEKNYHCFHPGCTSRFSRQDNMMQHYRTHLSPRSRRNRKLQQQQQQQQRSNESLPALKHITASAFNPYKRRNKEQSAANSPQHQNGYSDWPFYH